MQSRKKNRSPSSNSAPVANIDGKPQSWWRPWKIIATFAGVVLPLTAFFFAIQNVGDLKQSVLRLLTDDLVFSTARMESGAGIDRPRVVFSASNLTNSPVSLYSTIYANRQAANYESKLAAIEKLLVTTSDMGLNDLNQIVAPGKNEIVVQYLDAPLPPGLWTIVVKTNIGIKHVLLIVPEAQLTK